MTACYSVERKFEAVLVLIEIQNKNILGSSKNLQGYKYLELKSIKYSKKSRPKYNYILKPCRLIQFLNTGNTANDFSD